ncbi:MAG TPA: hypothetical protein VGD84_01075 [Pseudonocardiaceae bacterium]
MTSADSSTVLSSSQRDPVGEFGSGTGRNELGSTSELIAAFTGDWSESRCGLKPGPIESMAMMICVARGGGGVVVFDVSVLCGAGGGLTVQADVISVSAQSAATTRRGPGTLFRVSAGPKAELWRQHKRCRATGRRSGGRW